MSIRIANLACLLIIVATLPAIAHAQRAAGSRTAGAPAANAHTELLKCRDAAGRITYSDRGCDGAADARELRVNRYGATGIAPSAAVRSAPVARKRDASTRTARAGSSAAPAGHGVADRSPAVAAGVAIPGAAGAATPAQVAAGADERDALRATRDQHRRDVNRARTKASQLSTLPGYR